MVKISVNITERPRVTRMDTHDTELSFGVVIVLPLEKGVELPLKVGENFYNDEECFFFRGQVRVFYQIDEYPNTVTIIALKPINPGYDAALRDLLGEELYHLSEKPYSFIFDDATAAEVLRRLVTECSIETGA